MRGTTRRPFSDRGRENKVVDCFWFAHATSLTKRLGLQTSRPPPHRVILRHADLKKWASCGRVIGEPWKSKILMKGLPYTYRSWRRQMSASIRWIKMLAQKQFLIKNSDPPSNFDTKGRGNSQNKWTTNGNTSYQLKSFLQHSVIICASRDPQCMTFWFTLSENFKKKSSRDDFCKTVETRFQK